MNLRDIEDIIENNSIIYEMMKYCPYEILKHWEYRDYLPGDIICRQGEQYDRFLVIVEGYISIYFMSENGKRYIQSIYSKGNFIGELEIFDQRPYICFVEALTDSKLLSIKQEYFLKWIHLDIYAHTFITKNICNHFYVLSQKAGEDTLYSLKKRIYNYLISCCQNDKGNNSIRIKLGQLSEMFGVTSRSVNRILRHLKDAGAIAIISNSIIIKDLSILIKEERKEPG